jgi:hypothetical protein
MDKSFRLFSYRCGFTFYFQFHHSSFRVLQHFGDGNEITSMTKPYWLTRSQTAVSLVPYL